MKQQWTYIAFCTTKNRLQSPSNKIRDGETEKTGKTKEFCTEEDYNATSISSHQGYAHEQEDVQTVRPTVKICHNFKHKMMFLT
jgi:hypothetical protein